MAPRSSTSTKTHHQCWNVCPLGATSAAQMSGRKASSSQEKHALPETSKKLKTRSSLLVSLMTPPRCLPSQPSPNCCRASLMEENANAATVRVSSAKKKKTPLTPKTRVRHRVVKNWSLPEPFPDLTLPGPKPHSHRDHRPRGQQTPLKATFDAATQREIFANRCFLDRFTQT